MRNLLIQHDLVPLVINSNERARYISFLAEQDTPGLTRFIQATLEEERGRLQRFQNADEQQAGSDDSVFRKS
ncbi:hypothetical protein [Natribacillus halophilus]|uniref:Uncharacterized protein n=1 Tax=Natribacillus halophilus TaxID=549003 RepID=A0A1G8LX27_9BACI|nr:hypothetical protein [Natribacillus halophilus]SDI60239.1 hypothetical protein SAMN04488123_103325 [Natribacillus halophilus]